MDKKINLSDHPISFILFPLLVGIAVISYYRFFIDKDYLVGYDSECDPSQHSCFVVCEDTECTKESYYSHVIKYARDLYNECGKDITNCEKAKTCFPDNYNCSVTYCKPEVDKNMCSEYVNESAITSNKEKI